MNQEPSVRRPGDVIALHKLLANVLKMRKRAWATPGGRITSASVSAMDSSLLPPHSICGGFKTFAKDVGVPAMRGEVFIIHGYSMICIDFVDGAAGFDVIEVAFSERYCSTLGHKPLSDFNKRARNVLRSIRYTKGPPHDTLLGEAPVPPEGPPVALSGIGSTLETLTEIFPDTGTCSG